MASRYKTPRLLGGGSRRNARGKHTRNPGYQPGNHWLVCDLCSCDIRSAEARLRWDGFVVCPDDWEPRNEQDFVRGRIDRIAAQGLVRVPQDDIQVTVLPPTTPPPIIIPPPSGDILYNAEHVVDAAGAVNITCYSQVDYGTLYAAIRTSGPYGQDEREAIIRGFGAIWMNNQPCIKGQNGWVITGLPEGLVLYSGFVQRLPEDYQ